MAAEAHVCEGDCTLECALFGEVLSVCVHVCALGQCLLRLVFEYKG